MGLGCSQRIALNKVSVTGAMTAASVHKCTVVQLSSRPEFPALAHLVSTRAAASFVADDITTLRTLGVVPVLFCKPQTL